MHRHILILLGSSLAFHLLGTDLSVDKVTLTGRVTALETGAPLAGARVQFPDLRIGTVTRADGTYSVADLPAARLFVRVSLDGYAAVSGTVDLTVVASYDVQLARSVTEISEVVVTGHPHAVDRKRDPVPMALIDHTYLAQSASTNIIDALARVPGVSALSTGPNISKPYIRGLGYNRVLTLFDGVRQEGQQWGDEHGVEVDQFLVDRVEVVKGPASLMYGSDALAGVVNLLPAHPAPSGTVQGSMLAGYFTNNGRIAGSLAVDGSGKGVIWGARLSRKQASAYRNRYDGRVYGTKFLENDANAYVGINRSWGFSHLNISVYDDVQEIPDGSRDSTSRAFTRRITEEDTLREIVPAADLRSYTIADLHQRVQHFRAHTVNKFFLGNGRLAVNAGLQRSIRREYEHPEHPDIPGLYLILSTATYDVRYQPADLKGWESTFGLNGMVQRNNAAKGTDLIVPSYRSLDVGPFAHARRSFGRLDVSGGLRYDVRKYRSEAMYTRVDPATGFDVEAPGGTTDPDITQRFDRYATTFSGVSASAGASFAVNEQVTVKANVARGYRAPNAAELSSRGVHPGTGFAQYGATDFRPEFSVQFDGGVFFNSEHVTGSVEAFVNTIGNYIYNEKLLAADGTDSLFLQGGEEFPVYQYRQTRARLVGGEFSLDIHPHPLDWLHIENAVSFIHAANLGGNGALITDSTRYLPLIPPLRTNTVVRATVQNRVGRFSGLYARFGIQWFATQDRFYGAFGTETRTPGYTLLDAGIGGNVVDRSGRTLFSWSVLGTNLADIGYQSNMSRLKYFEDYPVNGTGRSGIYDMGRNISLQVVVPFQLKKEKPGE